MGETRDILALVSDVPALPTGATELVAMLQNPAVELAVVIRRIEYDPGLTSNLLRLANSAYFAQPRTIASVHEALVRLGTRRILQLVIATAVAPFARRPVKSYDLRPGQLLEHSIAVALAAEHLAANNGRSLGDHVFTAGLLHDLGKIVLGTLVNVDAAPIKALAAAEGLPFDEAERRMLGVDHAEVGAVLLSRWGLPDSVADAVRGHHRPELVPEAAGVARAIQSADALIHAAGIASEAPAPDAPPDMDPALAEQTLRRVQDALADLRAILGGR